MKKFTTLSIVALFAGSMMLGGCATDTLTGPELGSDRLEQTGGEGGSTSGVGDHNTGDKISGGGGSTSGVGDHNTGD